MTRIKVFVHMYLRQMILHSIMIKVCKFTSSVESAKQKNKKKNKKKQKKTKKNKKTAFWKMS